MYCDKCQEEAELKTFQTFSFYYCKNCKEEVKKKEPVKIKDESVWVKKSSHVWCSDPYCPTCGSK